MKRWQITLIAAWLAATPLCGQDIFPLNQIRPGLRGVCLTVLQGTQVEAIETEILGVQKGALGPGRDLIIGRLVDPRTALSGAVHGMSGSPLMIEGKLAGALSRRLMLFEKDGHCGFTPAADMFDVERRGNSTANAVAPWTSATWLSPEQWQSWGLRPKTQVPGDLLGVPVSLPQWDDISAAAFAPWLNRFPGLIPVAGRASSGGGAAAMPLEPGNALSVVLMDGDIHIAGTGTLTWTDGKRFMGFGHPMLGIGQTLLPVAPAEIVTIIPSYLTPHKLSNTGPIRGAMTQDRLSAISGSFATEAPMGRYHLQRFHQGERRPDWQGRFAQHELLTPFLVAMALRNLLIDEQDFSVEATLRIQGRIGLRGLPPLELDGLYSGDTSARMSALIDQIFPLLQLTNAYPKQVMVESLEATVATYETASVWEIFEVRPLVRAARPSEEVPVQVALRNARGQEKRLVARLRVPEEARSGPIILRASGGDLLAREAEMEERMGPSSGPEAMLRARKLYASDRVHIQMAILATGRTEEGWRLPALPPSVTRSTLNNHNLLRHVLAETSQPVNGVVRGSAETDLKVELP